jgi:hypothetical protein
MNERSIGAEFRIVFRFLKRFADFRVKGIYTIITYPAKFLCSLHFETKKHRHDTNSEK